MSLSNLRLALFTGCLLGVGMDAVADEVDRFSLRAPPVGVRIIELPPDAGAPAALRPRSHHALSFDTDAPKPWLRGLGLTPTDCALRLRLPARIGASKTAPGALHVDFQAQAGMGCRF